jgi:hypothetical protein
MEEKKLKIMSKQKGKKTVVFAPDQKYIMVSKIEPAVPLKTMFTFIPAFLKALASSQLAIRVINMIKTRNEAAPLLITT